jgi:AraC-like DNA-binding protein
MITTTEILPAPPLAPFVRCYAFREFDTRGTNLLKPWHASNEISLFFFFKALPVQLADPRTGEILKKGSYCDIVGIGTQYNGEMTFNGCYAFFEIAFKAGGFNKIFNICGSEFINQIVCAEDIFNNEIKVLYEQLYSAKNTREMAAWVNTFLLRHLKKQKSRDSKDIIMSASNLIIKNDGIANISNLANIANMSIRNFERQFIRQTGTPPKLLCSITRFNHAFSLKLNNPRESWASIATLSGYFDQMHLIREFKRFSGNPPSAFIRETPLTEEHYLNRVK